jgi:hypothetical protein
VDRGDQWAHCATDTCPRDADDDRPLNKVAGPPADWAAGTPCSVSF